jgi:hypothetical protein
MDEATLLDTPAASQAGYGDSSNLFSVIDRDRQVTFLGVLVELLFLLFTTIFDWVFQPLLPQNIIKNSNLITMNCDLPSVDFAIDWPRTRRAYATH